MFLLFVTVEIVIFHLVFLKNSFKVGSGNSEVGSVESEIESFKTQNQMLDDYQQLNERNKAVLAILITMSQVDQQVDQIEKQFILDVSRQLGLSLDEVETIREQPETFILRPPKSEQDRMTILYYLLFTMRVDGQIKPKEEELCHKVGFRLGFNNLMIDDLIQVMKDHPKGEVPPEKMLNEIKKYLN